MLVLTRAPGRHTILGATLDDSVGEAFDKTARLLGISDIPGGPRLEKMASAGDSSVYKLPKPLSKTRDASLRSGCDFSYAGLKSAVRQLLDEKLPAARRAALGEEATQLELCHVAAAFQRVAVEHLCDRTGRAIEWAREAEPTLSCIVVAGGVAANGEVRRRLGAVAAAAGLPLVCPPVRLCTDNGIMVAWTGYLRLKLGLADAPISAGEEVDLFVEVLPRWPLGARDARSRTQQQQLAKRSAASRENQRRAAAPAAAADDGEDGRDAKRAKGSAEGSLG